MKIKIIIAMLIITLMASTVYADATRIVNKTENNLGDFNDRDSITIYGTSSDGAIIGTSLSYSGARNAASGIIGYTDTNYSVGQMVLHTASFDTYFINRVFVYFDTSYIPAGAVIDSASLSLFCSWKVSEFQNFEVVVQNGQPTYPNDPMVAGDYYMGHYSGNGGSLNYNNFNPATYNSITLNSNGRSWINTGSGAVTKLCLRSSNDINNQPIAPGLTYQRDCVNFLSYDGNCAPRLIVEYSTPPTPQIELTPPSHDFGSVLVGSCSSDYSFTLQNVGDDTATGTVSLTGSDANQFTITSGGGSFSLGSGATKTINVKFCPTSSGYKSATLLADGSNCNDDSSGLSGNGANPQPQLSYSVTQMDFGTHEQGWSGSLTFEIWNSGTGTLSYTLTEDVQWLSVSPTYGTSQGEHDTITVSVGNTGSMSGINDELIGISSNGGYGDVYVYIKIIGDWTIIFYMSAEPGIYYYLNSCISSMAQVGSQNGIDILLLSDKAGYGDSEAKHIPAPGYGEPNIPLTDINPSWVNDEVNMGDPGTLIDFSIYCMNNYPAHKYLIIPWDHGGSWKGCCWDVDNDDHLNIADLSNAFSQIKIYNGNKKVDVVFFNDCLMNGVEIAYQLQQFVAYQAGSESVMNVEACDGEYVTILQTIRDNPDISPKDVANLFTDEQTPIDDPLYTATCISTISLDKMQILKNDFNTLANDLYKKLDDDTYRGQIENARNQSQHIVVDLFNVDLSVIIDLYDFASKIKSCVSDSATKNTAQNIMDIIGPQGGSPNTLIIDERHTPSASFCHGLSIYFPEVLSHYQSEYLDGNYFVSDTYWDEFLIKYLTPNYPPAKPAMPSGETNGKPGVEYTYATTTTDPNGDQVYYWFDWGDGTNSGWVGPYASGATGSAKHTWTEKGAYSIKVKAKDDNSVESEWSDTLPITMPRSRPLYNSIINRIMNQYPHLFALLQKVVKLLSYQ